jgi:hypothetical protein
MPNSARFSFRVWVHPKDGDPPEIEIWYQGLEVIAPEPRFVSEWAKESMGCEDFHSLFNLPDDTEWQVVGVASVHGSFDYWGEYDETLEIESFEKAEVPASWYGSGSVDEGAVR